jgi:hypothetical protein
MKFDFYNCLGLALIADYYQTSFQMTNGRGYDLNLLVPKSIGSQFASLFKDLDSNFNGFDCDEDPNYFWIEFASEIDKRKIDDYFQDFNLTHRQNAMIALPNLHEGAREVDEKLCEWYLKVIEGYLRDDFKGRIAIPFGVDESNENERIFMAYDEKGMKGLFKGSTIFKKSKIRFVNYFTLIYYWGDISILFLEALMSAKGETKTTQYAVVWESTKKIISNLKEFGTSEDDLKQSISYFAKIRDSFINKKSSEAIPLNLVSATLVAMCVRDALESKSSEELDLDFFMEIVNDAKVYLEGFELDFKI